VYSETLHKRYYLTESVTIVDFHLLVMSNNRELLIDKNSLHLT
jgi:hypothetical protein